MDSARPPQIVIVDVSPCRDAAAARAHLNEALGPALAPAASWTVRARFERRGARLFAHGDVTDADDITVATRTLSTPGSDCASLAKGLAVWASLVLDAEIDRAKPKDPVETTPPPAPPPFTPPPDVPVAGETAEERAKNRPLEANLFLTHRQDERTVELGLSAFVMGGTGGGAIVGPAASAVFELAHGVFLRPTLLGGHSVGGLTTGEASATFLASRFDACGRLPGLYREGRGLQLDLCGGGEVGFSLVDSGVLAAPAPGTQSSGTLPFVAIGPSFSLRGELGGGLAAVVRGVGELSFLRDSVTVQNGTLVTPPLVGGRAEVGLSWTLR